MIFSLPAGDRTWCMVPVFKTFSGNRFFSCTFADYQPLELFGDHFFILATGTGYHFIALPGDLFWPALIFTSFIIFGMCMGWPRGNITSRCGKPAHTLYILYCSRYNLIFTRSRSTPVWLWCVHYFLSTDWHLYLFFFLTAIWVGYSLTEHSAAVQMILVSLLGQPGLQGLLRNVTSLAFSRCSVHLSDGNAGIFYIPGARLILLYLVVFRKSKLSGVSLLR